MEAHPRTFARAGTGPLLQRDYWAAIAGCALRPSEFGALLATRFCELPPRELVHFRRADGGDGPLEVGDELVVHIRFAGRCEVRVIHRDEHSLTLATLRGHPEAGRITFGAYRHDDGRVIFHIRSIARSSSPTRYTGFLALGEPMQTDTWMDFVTRVAGLTGEGVDGFVNEETSQHADEESEDGPTFVAEGD